MAFNFWKGFPDKTTPLSAENLNKIWEGIYPIGAIYLSVVDTSPETLFGGTWVAFGEGKTLVGFDDADADFDEAEKTGGTKTHELTTAQMPTHTHTQNAHSHFTGNPNAGGSAGWYSTAGNAFNSTAATTSTTAVNQNTGGGEAHPNLQPYITVYMWKRTA
jgi:hypothetical protein